MQNSVESDHNRNFTIPVVTVTPVDSTTTTTTQVQTLRQKLFATPLP